MLEQVTIFRATISEYFRARTSIETNLLTSVPLCLQDQQNQARPTTTTNASKTAAIGQQQELFIELSKIDMRNLYDESA